MLTPLINAAGSRQQVFVETIFHTIYLCIVYDVQIGTITNVTKRYYFNVRYLRATVSVTIHSDHTFRCALCFPILLISDQEHGTVYELRYQIRETKSTILDDN